MDYKDFQKAFEDFIDDNPEAVEAYNQEHEVPMSQEVYNVYKPIINILDKYKKKSVNSIMSDVMPIVLSSKTDITSALEDYNDIKQVDTQNQNSLQIYFNEVKTVYDKNGNDYNIEYCPENREKIIEMNLKSVIAIAKKYKGMGVPMEDLISAGNLGLCVAFDKFNPERSNMKTKMIEALDSVQEDAITYDESYSILESVLQYGKTKKSFIDTFKKSKNCKVKDLKKWVKANVTNARFNSIAVMWIRAFILIELNNNSRPIKKTKNDIKDEKIYGKDVYIDINDRFGESGNNTVGDVLYVEDETISEQDRNEARLIYKEGLSKLLEGVKVRDRRILMQKFGIGYPRPMTPKEISQSESLSIARISQIFMSTIEKMKKNQEKYNLDKSLLYSAVDKLY